MKKQLTGKQIEALKQEVKLMRTFDHPHITKLYGVVQTHRHYYLIMEYCSGGDLERVRGKALGECAVQRIIHQLSSALQALNNRKIMHRDLKPSNLLLSGKDQSAVIKLADFGMARRLEPDEYAKTVCGTPLFMAPEILVGDPYDLKSDLWSIGVILYLFLTGRLPFEGFTQHQVLVALNKGVVQFPSHIAISDICIDLIRSLLQVNPKARIEWSRYFLHPFVSTSPEEYKARYPSLLRKSQLEFRITLPHPQSQSQSQSHIPGPSLAVVPTSAPAFPEASAPAATGAKPMSGSGCGRSEEGTSLVEEEKVVEGIAEMNKEEYVISWLVDKLPKEQSISSTTHYRRGIAAAGNHSERGGQDKCRARNLSRTRANPPGPLIYQGDL